MTNYETFEELYKDNAELIDVEFNARLEYRYNELITALENTNAYKERMRWGAVFSDPSAYRDIERDIKLNNETIVRVRKEIVDMNLPTYDDNVSMWLYDKMGEFDKECERLLEKARGRDIFRRDSLLHPINGRRPENLYEEFKLLMIDCAQSYVRRAVFDLANVKFNR